MSAEEVTAQDMPADLNGAGPAPAAVSVTPSSTKKGNSYYYWHGHEKDRALVGDVAPKTSPMLVKTDDVPSEYERSPLLASRSITKYSWCNNNKSVSVYIDFDGCQDLPAANIQVHFEPHKLLVQVRGATEGAPLNVLMLRLSKEIAPEKSSFRLKVNQIVIKLDKGDSDATWFDLVDNKAAPEFD